MTTNLLIDPALFERALELSSERTKKGVVTRAPEDFIARRGQKRLVEVMGKLERDPAYDYKAERSRDRSTTPASGCLRCAATLRRVKPRFRGCVVHCVRRCKAASRNSGATDNRHRCFSRAVLPS